MKTKEVSNATAHEVARSEHTPLAARDDVEAMNAAASDSCEGCKHRHWVQAAPLGYTMSRSGWGCLWTGGHAIKRCQGFLL